VTVSEKGRENDEPGIYWLKGNTEGWANFLACLKAYLEYGINLRQGAFDFLADKNLALHQTDAGEQKTYPRLSVKMEYPP